MSKAKNKFIFSFLVVASFIIYTIIQGIGRITSRLVGASSGLPLSNSLTAGNPTTLALNPPASNNSLNTNPTAIPRYSIVTSSPAPTKKTIVSSPQTAVAVATPAAMPNTSTSRSQMGQGMMGGSNNTAPMGKFRDGVYTGTSADAYYGNVQVKVTIQSGRITNVQFLDYPHDQGNSLYINSFAVPNLSSEAIAAQSANVDIVSGATETSRAFIQSLSSALSQA